MKSNNYIDIRNQMIRWAGLMTVALLLAGCITHRTCVYGDDAECIRAVPAPPPPASGLQARYEAAKAISSFTDRDAVLAKLAQDAAGAGDVALTKRALAGISSFTVRDEAAARAARALAQHGLRMEAIEVARTISSFTNRDAVLGDLAR